MMESKIEVISRLKAAEDHKSRGLVHTLDTQLVTVFTDETGAQLEVGFRNGVLYVREREGRTLSITPVVANEVRIHAGPF